MILKNIGSKIVNVGSVVVMPGSDHPFPKTALDTPAIKALCKLGFLEIVDEPETAEKPAEQEKPVAGMNEPETAEGTKKQEEPKKTGRGKKKAE